MSVPARNPKLVSSAQADMSADGVARTAAVHVSDGDRVQFDSSPQPQQDLITRRVADIAAAIERQVMPLLAVGRRPLAPSSIDPKTQVGGPSVILGARRRLTRALLRDDLGAAEAILTELQALGVTSDALYSAVLAESARELGSMWETDACSFVDVTLGLGRLHQLMIRHSEQFHANRRAPIRGKRVLLNLTPGEHHRFGLAMVAEYLDRAGWEVLRPGADTVAGIAQAASAGKCRLVGLSIGSEERLAHLIECIASLRRMDNGNGGIAIMAGGPLFVRKPELAHRIGADSICTSAEEAVRHAEALFALMCVTTGTGQQSSLGAVKDSVSSEQGR